MAQIVVIADVATIPAALIGYLVIRDPWLLVYALAGLAILGLVLHLSGYARQQ